MTTKKTYADPKKPKDPNERVRKLGEREEQLEIRLTQLEMDDYHNQHLALSNQRDELEEKLAEVKANYKAQFEAIDLQVAATRRLLNTRRRTATVKVEEWLTASNEVIRLRADTNEQLGDLRKARADELQEKLFPDNPPDSATPGAQQEGAPTEDDPMFGTGDALG